MGQRTRDRRTEDGKQSNKGYVQWYRATEKGTQGHLIGITRQRKEEMRQQTDHVRHGTKDGRQGTETRDRGQRTGDKEQRHKRGHRTRDKEQKQAGVHRMGDKGRNKGTEERLTGGTEEKVCKWCSEKIFENA
jgi:hypothetical protein